MNTEDRLAIHELLARSAYALDEHDFDQLESCFTEDAVFIVNIAGIDGENRFEGRAAIMELMRSSMAEQTDQRRHITTNVMIREAGEGTATVISNLTLTAVEKGAIRLVTSGYYRDRVQRTKQGWLLAERRVDLDMPY